MEKEWFRIAIYTVRHSKENSRGRKEMYVLTCLHPERREGPVGPNTMGSACLLSRNDVQSYLRRNTDLFETLRIFHANNFEETPESFLTECKKRDEKSQEGQIVKIYVDVGKLTQTKKQMDLLAAIEELAQVMFDNGDGNSNPEFIKSIANLIKQGKEPSL